MSCRTKAPTLLFLVLSILALGNALPAQAQTRFKFTIDRDMPLKGLLPVPPKPTHAVNVAGFGDLSLVPGLRGSVLFQVPEVEFEDPVTVKKVPVQKQARHIAFLIAKIKHVNQKKTDHYLSLLQKHRADLSGVPFVKGKACRLEKEYSREFARTVRCVRIALSNRFNDKKLSVIAQFKRVSAIESESASKTLSADEVERARIAVFMQMLVAQPLIVQKDLVQYLGASNHKEAALGLGRLAIFPFQEEIREDARRALMKRNSTKDITDLLLQGLHYPYPAVAKNTVQLIAELKRNDMIPHLVNFLDKGDPLAPVLQETGGQKCWVVRELVRINHHRNCLLCHAPGDVDTVAPPLIGPVPSPGARLPITGYYNPPHPDVVVRADVTYLRQDFTRMLPVENARPWPEYQRYDFLVRTRKLPPNELLVYQRKPERPTPQGISASHEAVLAGLQKMTGWKVGPSAKAWRQRLGLPD